MEQHRLSDLCVLNIENEKMRSLGINMLVDKFDQKMLEDRRNLSKIFKFSNI